MVLVIYKNTHINVDAHPTSTQPIGGILEEYSETQSFIQSARDPCLAVISRPTGVCLMPTASSSDTKPRLPICFKTKIYYLVN